MTRKIGDIHGELAQSRQLALYPVEEGLLGVSKLKFLHLCKIYGSEPLLETRHPRRVLRFQFRDDPAEQVLDLVGERPLWLIVELSLSGTVFKVVVGTANAHNGGNRSPSLKSDDQGSSDATYPVNEKSTSRLVTLEQVAGALYRSESPGPSPR